MSKFINNISQFIHEQFPEHLKEKVGVDVTDSSREVIIDFVEAYYEFVEENYQTNYLLNRLIIDNRNIDKTMEDFVQHFRSKYLKNISYDIIVDERFAVKHIMDLYRSKGSPNAVKLLIRLLFDSDAEIYIPGQDVLRASDSIWYEAQYVETLTNPRNRDFINNKIWGSISGASAFVESVVSKRVLGRQLDIVYISQLDKNFLYGDRLSNTQLYDNDSPLVSGSLTSVQLDPSNIGDFAIGDVIDLESITGFKGKGVVRSTFDRSRGVDFELTDGGYAYTLDNLTNLNISDFVIMIDNLPTPLYFSNDDVVTQKLEKLYITSNTNFNGGFSVGDVVTGMDSSNTAIANGTIMETGNNTVDSVYTEYVVVQVSENTFLNTEDITFASNTTFIVGEEVRESSDITLSVANTSGTFNVGELAYWNETYEIANNVSSDFSFGDIVSANTTEVVLEHAFGTFTANTSILGSNSGATAKILSVNITTQGAIGNVVENFDHNTTNVRVSSGSFDAGNKVYGLSSRVVIVANNIVFGGVSSIIVNNTQSDIQTEISEDNSFVGLVVDQDGIGIGIANTSSHDFVLDTFSNTSILSTSNTSLNVTAISSSDGVAVSIKTLSNQQEVEVGNEVLDYVNIAGVNIPTVYLDGAGSGVGYINSIAVGAGGTNYSNGESVVFSGGGYLGQDVIFSAAAHVLTTANVITSVVITDGGEGYFGEPSVTVAGGSSANLVVDMRYGYGFEADILSNSNTVIADVLTNTNTIIGTIDTISYTFAAGVDRKPFIRFVNPTTKFYNVEDQVLTISTVSGSFIVGEIIQQGNTAGNTAIGSIKTKTNQTYKVRQLTMGGTIDDNRYFQVGDTVVGASTGSVGTVDAVSFDTTAELAGDNAVITPLLISAVGVIDALEITDSGYGYEDEQVITMRNDAGEIITGVADVSKQGKSTGYWKTSTSELNSNKKLHDNNYYQEYSYDIKTDISLNYYKNIVLDLLHMPGSKLFGSVSKQSEQTLSINSESSIVQANT